MKQHQKSNTPHTIVTNYFSMVKQVDPVNRVIGPNAGGNMGGQENGGVNVGFGGGGINGDMIEFFDSETNSKDAFANLLGGGQHPYRNNPNLHLPSTPLTGSR